MTAWPIPESSFPVAAADVWQLGAERVEWLRQMFRIGAVVPVRTRHGVFYYRAQCQRP